MMKKFLKKLMKIPLTPHTSKKKMETLYKYTLKIKKKLTELYQLFNINFCEQGYILCNISSPKSCGS